MYKYWLKCHSSQGMFPHEMAASSSTSDGIQFSLFADRFLFKNPEQYGDNSLQVYALNLGDGRYQIVLPTDPFETGRSVYVHEQLIEGMAA